jgi:hypothetical protein
VPRRVKVANQRRYGTKTDAKARVLALLALFDFGINDGLTIPTIGRLKPWREANNWLAGEGKDDCEGN